MRNVLFITPFPDRSMESAGAVAGLDDVRMLGITQEAPSAGDAKVFADVITVDDGDDPAQLIAAARVLEQRHGRIHRVVGIREALQVPLAEVRRALGVPGLDPEVADRFRNKARMKDELRRHGVACARHYLIRSPDDADAAVAEVGLPLVLKPPYGSGGKGIRRIRTIDELRGALAGLQTSRENSILAEELVVGREFSFDTITLGGEVQFYSLSQYHTTILEVMETPTSQYMCVLPRDISGPEWSDAVDLGVRAIRALGFDSGMTHMEWFRRDDGSLAVGEIAARPPGCNIMSMICFAYDTNMHCAWARAAVDGAFDGGFVRRYAVGCAYLRGIGRGRVQRLTGVERARELVGRLMVKTHLPQLGAPRSESYEGDGYIFVRHPETEVVTAATKTIVETIGIEYG